MTPMYSHDASNSSPISLRSVLEMVVRDICEIASQVPWPERTFQRIAQHNETGSQWTRELHPCFPLQALQHIVEQLPSFDQVTRLVLDTPAYKRVVALPDEALASTYEDKRGRVLVNLIGTFLHAYLSQTERFQFDDRIFAIVFERVMLDLEISAVEVSYVAPLMNLHLSQETVVVSEDVRLRRSLP